MKIVLRVAGPLFIAVGLFWFAQGTGLLPWPHNSATVDYGAGVAAVGIGLGSKCSRSPQIAPGETSDGGTERPAHDSLHRSMCNHYSITKYQAAIRDLFKVAHDTPGAAAVLR